MRVAKIGALGFVLAGAAAFAAPPTCYFLMSSGCGSGASFCTQGQIVCDIGYSSSVDTGCGAYGPLGGSEWRECHKLMNTLTVPCDAQSPGGVYQPTGCKQNGICCYASSIVVSSGPNQMSVPIGSPCHCDDETPPP
jgi:hypothetical protein